MLWVVVVVVVLVSFSLTIFFSWFSISSHYNWSFSFYCSLLSKFHIALQMLNTHIQTHFVCLYVRVSSQNPQITAYSNLVRPWLVHGRRWWDASRTKPRPVQTETHTQTHINPNVKVIKWNNVFTYKLITQSRNLYRSIQKDFRTFQSTLLNIIMY